MTENGDRGARRAGGMAQEWPRVVALLALLGGLLLVCVGTPEVREGDVAGVIMSLPEKLGDWTGEEIPMAESERDLLPAGTELARKKYTDGRGSWLVCTIVLSSADRRSLHKPEICLPGQGWSTDSGRVVPVALAGGTELPVMCLEISRPMPQPGGGSAKLRGKFLYWFVGRDVLTPRHWERIFRTAYDRIFRGVGHRWAYISVMAVETGGMQADGLGGDTLATNVERFISGLAPEVVRPELLRPGVD
ncbi:MAG: exosortase-associated EpsI family protein [Verrucomicrobiae bacterium]|nr:exosortase-associated EpsI family protein [Verrucomicrobiae bacterium]